VWRRKGGWWCQGKKGKGPSQGRRRRRRDESVKEGGVFANVNAESVRGPTPKGLDAVVRPPAGGKKGGTPGAEGVTAEGSREEAVQASKVPRAGGDSAERVEPQVRVKACETIAASKIGCKDRDRIKGSRRGARHKNDVPFENAIGFMRREVI
jgi:hypothetical protein